MRYLDIFFRCRMTTDGIFSAYKGSMLRGALGNQLHRLLCIADTRDCSTCAFCGGCTYRRLFAAAATPDNCSFSPMLAPPFCIEPEKNFKTRYAAGELFTFNLKLFAFATEYLPFFVHAFSAAGREGMGRHKPEGKFEITDILHNGSPIYDSQRRKLAICKPENLRAPRLVSDGMDKNIAETVIITLITPLRFKMENRLSSILEFYTILKLIHRRLKALWALESETFHIPQNEYDEAAKAAAKIHIAENSLSWEDWSRYSNHQHTSMQLGGLSGNIVYIGKSGCFTEYLDFAAKTHLGKQTSFGLGELSFCYPPNEERDA